MPRRRAECVAEPRRAARSSSPPSLPSPRRPRGADVKVLDPALPAAAAPRVPRLSPGRRPRGALPAPQGAPAAVRGGSGRARSSVRRLRKAPQRGQCSLRNLRNAAEAGAAPERLPVAQVA